MNRRQKNPAKGSCRRDDPNQLWPQVVIRFDRETFEQIRARAARRQTSFTEQVRILIEWGLEAERLDKGDAA